MSNASLSVLAKEEKHSCDGLIFSGKILSLGFCAGDATVDVCIDAHSK